MKLAINILLSLGMLALCVWLVWPSSAHSLSCVAFHEALGGDWPSTCSSTRDQLEHVIQQYRFVDFAPYLATYIGLLVIIQLCRSLRWRFLLAPLGVTIPTAPLLAISSVGFMAILALPARLGELVRPGLLRKRGDLSASAALGTVAVERIVDGLLVSLFVFGALFGMRNSPNAQGWMMPMAYAALGGFLAAMVFLIFALRKAEPTIAFCVKLTLLPKIAPRFARVLEAKLLEMVRGFVVLEDKRNLAMFVLWSVVYWTANGVTVYVLAHAFGLPLSLVGAFATMGVCAVGIMLPNSPGLVGQFQFFTLLGVGLYLGFDPRSDRQSELYVTAYAFANLHYLLQVGWYILCGALGLASRYVSFHDLWSVRSKTSA